ncbi:hypothetical protein EsH8_III_001192 [Colletotrichum jinshuiense]
MVFPGSNVGGRSEVTVVSSDSGPPRLDLALTRGRRGTFSSFDSDGERGFYPRTTRSSNDLFMQALDRFDTTDYDSEWGAVRARARENCDREGMADLIDFFRTTSPPPEFPPQSVFEEDATEPQEPEKWGLFKKLRRPRTRARSESPARRPVTAGLPNSAVASKTSSGNSHIAISIPLEYCHVGPDSDWALAIFNATPPLPPTPPVRRSEDETGNGIPGPYASERTVTVLKTVSEKGSFSTINTVHTANTKRGTKGSVSIWPKIKPNPWSPPRTPYTTPPGSLRGRLSTKKKHDRLPHPPPQYAELPASPVSEAIVPSSGPDKNSGFGKGEGPITQPASPKSRKPKVKAPPRRPENITLPPRKSSIRITRPNQDPDLDNRDSTCYTIGADSQRQSTLFSHSQPSPGAHSEAPSISPSIATTELSEPIVISARSAKAYSMASIVQRDTPCMTPRQSFITRPGSSDTAQTTLVGESVASRNPSTKTAASRQSRKERVKSLKQRDMEALKASTRQLQQAEDGEVTPRPRTCETAISSLRLPSRDGTFGTPDRIPEDHGIGTKLSATNLANMARSQGTSSNRRSHGTSAKISDWQASQQAETSGWETAREIPTPEWANAPFLSAITEGQLSSTGAGADTFGKGAFRDSTSSFEPPRRWGSLHRTSWASSVPLLDRIGSFAPSDASVTHITEADNSFSPPSPPRMTRADSATLSQMDSDRLYTTRLSYFGSDDEAKPDHIEDDHQSIAGSIAAFPKPGSGPRLSAIMPVAEVVPTLSVDERWSDSTLNSPMTVVEVSHPPFASTQTPGQDSTQMVPDTAGNTNTVVVNTATDGGRADRQGVQSPTPTSDDSEADETATLRPKSQEDPLNLVSMSARELRNHYANLRHARVSDLAHEMLLNQERLELRMHQQERNQMLFIERLERCMNELRGFPITPLSGSRPLDWPLDNDFIYEEQHISRDSTQEVRVLRTGRINNNNNRSQSEFHHSRRRIVESMGEFDDFTRDFVDRTPRRRSTSHAHPRRAWGSRHQAMMVVPSLVPRGGLDAMEPLIRELQLASRVSLETSLSAEQND